jgi:hypothetical protein
MPPRRAMETDVRAIDLRRTWSVDSAAHAVRHAPRYERFAYAARHTIRMLHGVAAIGRDRGVQMYLGRTAANGPSVAGRFRDHSDPDGRDHEFGAVLFRGPTSDVVRWEGRLNRALGVLSDRGALGVANLAGDGRGPITPRRCSVVYLTWTFVGGGRSRPVTGADLRAIVREFKRMGDELTRDGVTYAFEGLLEPDDAGTIGFVGADGSGARLGGYFAEKRSRIVVPALTLRRR